MNQSNQIKIGLIGTGFIARGLILAIDKLSDIGITKILTRRNLEHLSHFDRYTDSIHELIETNDIIIECSGDTIYSTEKVASVLEASVPVVTLNAELHVTSGTFLSEKGFITEAQGDQPGTLAAFNRDLLAMGFKPLVYGNLKGYLNHHPTHESMKYWADIQGISLEQVTGFTDGTKLQFEQALVANGLGAAIAKPGMFGFMTDNIIEGSYKLAEEAKIHGSPISDYLLCDPESTKKFPAGIFITAEHDPEQAAYLKYLKLGDGPFYTLMQNYHLCHLEMIKTIRDVYQTKNVLLDNSSQPTASVATIAKINLIPGTKIESQQGNFQVRGEAIPIQSAPNHLPFGLIRDAVVLRNIEPGQILTFDDVELPDSLAYHAWQFTLKRSQKRNN